MKVKCNKCGKVPASEVERYGTCSACENNKGVRHIVACTGVRHKKCRRQIQVTMKLKEYFRKKETEANNIMLEAHKKGRGNAWIYTLEVAATKVSQVHAFAKSQQHPLKCSLEPDK